MKLYFSPGACSLSPHIVLREAGFTFDLEKVDLKSHKTASGEDFYGINPKGYVPALKLDDGTLLTEGPAITQYLADLKPEAKLLAPVGKLERYQAIEWLNFVGTELHKTFGPLFNPATPADAKKATLEKLTSRFALAAKALEHRPYLMGEQFSLPDAYLFVVLRWATHLAQDAVAQPSLKAFFERVAKRPAVQAALKAEGLH